MVSKKRQYVSVVVSIEINLLGRFHRMYIGS